MMEDEEYVTPSSSLSPIIYSPHVNANDSMNATIDATDATQTGQKSTPYLIPDSPTLESDNIEYDVVSEVDLTQKISTDNRQHQPNQDSIDHSKQNDNLDSSPDNVGIEDLETGEILTQTEKPSRSNNDGKITSFYRTAIPTTDTVYLKKKKESNSSQESPSSSNIESLTPLQSPLQTSVLSPTFTPLSSPFSSSAPPSPSNNLTKEYRPTSSNRSSPSTKQRRHSRERTDSGSRRTTTIVHKGKKVIRLSIPEPSSSAHTMPHNEEIPTSPSLSSGTTSRSPSRALRYLLPTGYIYDVFMSYHATLDTFDIHPEDPRRIFFIYREMLSQKLLENCQRIPIQKATQRDILAVHDLELLKALAKTKDMKRKELVELENTSDSIYINNHSYEASLYAAGGVIELCKAVVQDRIKNGFAIVRPPGHHAESDISMGFCFINNVAIATQYCIQRLGLKRIFIVDWDVHFGNGTHQIFANNPDVLYLSIHRYNNGSFYPGYDNGGIENVGDDPAKGRSVNIPWPNEGATDDDYLYAFHQVVMPIGYEFQPDLVIVSAGFDAADGDDIGMCNVTPSGFSNMTHLLKSLANGRMVMALEGGYNLKATSVSATACMSVLMGEAPLPLKTQKPSTSAIATVNKVKSIHSKYWHTLRR